MPITDLIPWKKKEVARREAEEDLQAADYPFLTFQQEMNRLFDEFFKGTGLDTFGVLGEGWDLLRPPVDVVETDKEIRVTVELPGLDEKDINVSLARDVLTISGEKKQAKKERRGNYYRAERSYGSFRRSIQLPTQVQADKVDAVFRKGVLSITLPKTEAAQKRKKIAIQTH